MASVIYPEEKGTIYECMIKIVNVNVGNHAAKKGGCIVAKGNILEGIEARF